jgi:hypothetical protein
MLKTASSLALVFLLIAVTVPAYGGTGVLWIDVKDRDTHQPIAAKIRIEGPQSLAADTDKDGKLRLQLPPGQYQVFVFAPRYRTAQWQVRLWGNAAEDRPQEVNLFHAFADAPVYGQTGALTITVREAWTNYAVQAKVEIDGPKRLTMQTDNDGSLKLSLPTGDDYLIQISAPGYKAFGWQALMIRPGENTSGALLEPLNGPQWPPLIKALEAQLKPGYAAVAGSALSKQGHPIAGVRVTLGGNGIQTVSTITDSTGYYGFLIPTPPPTPPTPDQPTGLPGTGEITMMKPGYKTQLHHDVPIMDNEFNGTSLVEMEPGSGTTESNDAPAWMTGTSGSCVAEGADCDLDESPEHLKAKPK